MRIIARRTPDLVDSKGLPLPRSVAALKVPMIGGTPQGVLVRGRDNRNPGLLILHGGPGGAYIGCARAWFGFLEERWVVVNWDQRGAGLSYSPRVDPLSLTAERLTKDALEVQDWVRQRFGVDRWFLMAHSFGTRLAPYVLRHGPDRFEGFFAVGPAPTDAVAETESYEWTLRRARELSRRRAIRELEEIGPPPYRSEFGGLEVRAKWTDRLGGAVEGSTGNDLAFRALRAGSEYTWGDLLRRLLPGVRFWMQNVDSSLGSVSLGEGGWDLPVSLTVIGGSGDWMSPVAAARRTFDRARAPRKRFLGLEGLGHYPFAQDAKRFEAALNE